jgi:hypothetical protein
MLAVTWWKFGSPAGFFFDGSARARAITLATSKLSTRTRANLHR